MKSIIWKTLFARRLFVPQGYRLDARGWKPQAGSVEHYYHFLVGYMLPIAQQVRSKEAIRVLDCGPLMNPILIETLRLIGVSAKVWKGGLVGRVHHLPRWDKELPREEDLAEPIKVVKEAWGQTSSCNRVDCGPKNNILLVRSPEHEFYRSSKARIQTYGQGRRSLTNLDSIADYLESHSVDYLAYAPGEHSLGCQIRVFESAIRISGIRGAEWANLVWSPSDTAVRVVYPENEVSLLRRFIPSLVENYQEVLVAGSHVEDSQHQVMEFFTQ